MGIFSDIKAMSEMQKINCGGKGYLSISNITNMIISLNNASRNLSPEDARTVRTIYGKLRKCKNKILLDKKGYLQTSIDIIKEFDKYVDAEKILGLEPYENFLIISEIRNINL